MTSQVLDYSVHIDEIIEEDIIDGYRSVSLITDRGRIDMRYYEAQPGATAGVIWAGGVGGGWETPLFDLYPDLSNKLRSEGIASLWVKYRSPIDLEESTYDVIAGIEYLKSQGLTSIGLGGWSFGGAVVIRTAAFTSGVRTVVTFSTQSYGADVVEKLPKDCSLLLLHGSKDTTLSPHNSERIFSKAHEPKKLIILKGANHGLDQASEEVRRVVFDWMVTQLLK